MAKYRGPVCELCGTEQKSSLSKGAYRIAKRFVRKEFANLTDLADKEQFVVERYSKY